MKITGSAGALRLVWAALAMSALILAAAAWWCLVGAAPCSFSSFFLTADQQGQRLYRRAQYGEAAQRFGNPAWRAAALFRAGEYKEAAGIYAGMTSAEAAYNRGNALLMQGLYEDAVERYDRALSLRPDWREAVVNREIAVERAERLKKEGGDMTGGMLGADEISFVKGGNPSKQQPDTFESVEQNPAEMRAVWLRQVQTKPADFLKAKFAYQMAMKRKE